jgi:hypothetical protein
LAPRRQGWAPPAHGGLEPLEQVAGDLVQLAVLAIRQMVEIRLHGV